MAVNPPCARCAARGGEPLERFGGGGVLPRHKVVVVVVRVAAAASAFAGADGFPHLARPLFPLDCLAARVDHRLVLPLSTLSVAKRDTTTQYDIAVYRII